MKIIKAKIIMDWNEQSINEINRRVFIEHVNELREYSERGQLVTDLYILIKKQKAIDEQIEQEKLDLERFKRDGARVFDMNGNYLRTEPHAR